jgi:hypothetical protein
MSAPRIGNLVNNAEAGMGMPSMGTAPRLNLLNANIERGIANAASRAALLNNIRRGANLRHMYPEPSAPPLNSTKLKPYLNTIKGLRNQIQNTTNNARKRELTNGIRNAIVETRGVLRMHRGNLVGSFSDEDKSLLRRIKSNVTFRNIGNMQPNARNNNNTRINITNSNNLPPYVGGKSRRHRKSRKASRRRLTRRRR